MLEGFHLVAPGALTLGDSSYAMRVINADLTLRTMVLTPGNGAAGVPGRSPGGVGESGDDAVPARPGRGCNAVGRGGAWGAGGSYVFGILPRDGDDGGDGDGVAGGGGAGGITQPTPDARR